MFIIVNAVLFVPDDRMFIGGRNTPIFRKSTKIRVTVDLICGLIGQYACVTIDTIHCRVLRAEKKNGYLVLNVVGQMESLSIAHMNRLAARSWIIDEKAACMYRLPGYT